MKAMYIKPIVEQISLMPSSIVLAGSPGINVNPEPIDAGEGGD